MADDEEDNFGEVPQHSDLIGIMWAWIYVFQYIVRTYIISGMVEIICTMYIKYLIRCYHLLRVTNNIKLFFLISLLLLLFIIISCCINLGYFFFLGGSYKKWWNHLTDLAYFDTLCTQVNNVPLQPCQLLPMPSHKNRWAFKQNIWL